MVAAAQLLPGEQLTAVSSSMGGGGFSRGGGGGGGYRGGAAVVADVAAAAGDAGDNATEEKNKMKPKSNIMTSTKSLASVTLAVSCVA